MISDYDAAKILIRCLDLTSLSGTETTAQITKLCQNAIRHNVAAVCVYPRFINQVKKELKNSDIHIATVINFPKPKTDLTKISSEITEALKLGANEIDAVFPYDEFLKGNLNICEDFLRLCRSSTNDHALLKIILETGVLKKTGLIAQATSLCLKHQVDFIKTSTGKTDISATPEAANIILETIHSAKSQAGFKASGGLKTIDDAKKYLVLANTIMGHNWVNPNHFRLGASSLLDNLLEVVERGY